MAGWEGQLYEPNRLLTDHIGVAMRTSHGLLMTIGARVAWQLRCDMIFRSRSLDEFFP